MKFNLNKRQKIVITATLLTIGLLSTQLVDFNLRFRFIAGLGILAYILTLWSLWEGIDRTKMVILLILPTFYTVAVASFYFLLPVRWLTRLPVALFFGLSFYLLQLCQNVFNVAAIRTIPLYRAASTASFLFTLITALFLYNVIFAFNLAFLWSGLIIFLVTFPLIVQTFWNIEMENVSLLILIQSFVLSLIIGEFAIALSFWPMPITMRSLALASSLYIMVGLMTQELRSRLQKRVVWEYILIGVTVLLASFVTSSWTG